MKLDSIMTKCCIVTIISETKINIEGNKHEKFI